MICNIMTDDKLCSRLVKSKLQKALINSSTCAAKSTSRRDDIDTYPKRILKTLAVAIT